MILFVFRNAFFGLLIEWRHVTTLGHSSFNILNVLSVHKRKVPTGVRCVMVKVLDKTEDALVTKNDQQRVWLGSRCQQFLPKIHLMIQV